MLARMALVFVLALSLGGCFYSTESLFDTKPVDLTDRFGTTFELAFEAKDIAGLQNSRWRWDRTVQKYRNVAAPGDTLAVRYAGTARTLLIEARLAETRNMTIYYYFWAAEIEKNRFWVGQGAPAKLHAAMKRIESIARRGAGGAREQLAYAGLRSVKFNEALTNARFHDLLALQTAFSLHEVLDMKAVMRQASYVGAWVDVYPDLP